MKTFGIIAMALVLSLSASTLWASGSTAPAYATPETAPDPLLVTQTMKCEVLEIAERGQVKIRDPKTQEVSWIQVTEDTKVLAQDKKAFDGRKKLERTDLAEGQMLRITHRPNTGEVVKIKVLRGA